MSCFFKFYKKTNKRKVDEDPFDKDGRCHYRKAEPQGSEKVPGKKEFDKVSKKHSKAEH